ncbi:MAG: hypothetical protein NT062_28815 [Proteobacteria bacterium]|nr:hypothetical protein [Pseudomonadota bacterium]
MMVSSALGIRKLATSSWSSEIRRSNVARPISSKRAALLTLPCVELSARMIAVVSTASIVGASGLSGTARAGGAGLPTVTAPQLKLDHGALARRGARGGHRHDRRGLRAA